MVAATKPRLASAALDAEPVLGSCLPAGTLTVDFSSVAMYYSKFNLLYKNVELLAHPSIISYITKYSIISSPSIWLEITELFSALISYQKIILRFIQLDLVYQFTISIDSIAVYCCINCKHT